MLAHMVFNISLVTLIVRARFVGMGSTLEEASFDLGAAPLATFRQVTLPRLLPAILAGFLLIFTFSFDDYVLSQFTAGPSTETWPILVFAAVRFGITPKLNAFASVMLLVTRPRAAARRSDPATQPRHDRRDRVARRRARPRLTRDPSGPQTHESGRPVTGQPLPEDNSSSTTSHARESARPPGNGVRCGRRRRSPLSMREK